MAGCGGGGGGNGQPADTIAQPEVASSRDGVLELTLRQAPAKVTVAGTTITSNVFNDTYVPPVIKLKRGDRLALTLRNRIGKGDVQIDGPQETNLHYHGMSISPIAPADDIFLHVGAGADYLYSWQVPMDHPQGTHWYHPHPHGLVEPQILSGMSGLMVIDGLLDHFPAFAGLPERHFLLKDIQLPGADDGAPLTKTINGVLGGTLHLRPGDMQVWHVGNVGADAYFDLAVDGAQLWELARDGNLRARPEPRTSLFLPPGSRSTLIVRAADAAGSYAIRTLNVDTGPQGDPNPEVQLATLVVGGARQDTGALLARIGEPAVQRDTLTPEQVAALPIARRRTVTFSETADGNTFFIDGKVYDVARDDVTVNLGDVEEWTIRNVSGERHVFHIHQLDFLVTSINNQDVDELGLRDVIDLPYQQNGVPGEVRVIIPFTNPLMVGRFVFHCHIVEHEDGGMMANIVVLPPGQTALPTARMRVVPPSSLAGAWKSMLPRAISQRLSPPAPWEDAVCRSDGRTAMAAVAPSTPSPR
jgi:FtsP/CotA-like multicopper oxidase with cupredoxin domain